MADIKPNCPTGSTNFKEAVCVQAGRIYDSCCDRDCFESLPVYFSPANRQLIADAQNARLRSAEVVYANIDVEPVNFHRGYYSVAMTFYFRVNLDITPCGGCSPTQITGLAFADKQVVLYGSEGAVKSFSSDGCDDLQLGDCVSLPRAVVQAVDPVPLSAELLNCPVVPVSYTFPNEVLSLAGGNVAAPALGEPTVEVTLGLFTIVELIRDVQLLLPAYDFSFPEKKCPDTTDSPCDVFRSIHFPTDDFFPPRPCNLSGGCDCPGNIE